LPSKNPILRLENVLENIERIEEYTCGLSRQSFIGAEKTRDAVERCLEPDQPWPAIRAVGNVLRHEYDRVDPDVIWRIITDDLKALRAAVESALGKLRREAP
jgi:uncharacterized protein with HEPN domain